jgi:hypothetical protein
MRHSGLHLTPTMHLDRLIEYTTLAATTAAEMANTFQVPFLASTATLVLSILNCVEVSRGVSMLGSRNRLIIHIVK